MRKVSGKPIVYAGHRQPNRISMFENDQFDPHIAITGLQMYPHLYIIKVSFKYIINQSILILHDRKCIFVIHTYFFKYSKRCFKFTKKITKDVFQTWNYYDNTKNDFKKTWISHITFPIYHVQNCIPSTFFSRISRAIHHIILYQHPLRHNLRKLTKKRSNIYFFSLCSEASLVPFIANETKNLLCENTDFRRETTAHTRIRLALTRKSVFPDNKGMFFPVPGTGGK